LSLLKLKPENETWAVLVNEFGEIGIDAGLIGG
jgi:G3E family GTPase